MMYILSDAQNNNDTYLFSLVVYLDSEWSRTQISIWQICYE